MISAWPSKGVVLSFNEGWPDNEDLLVDCELVDWELVPLARRFVPWLSLLSWLLKLAFRFGIVQISCSTHRKERRKCRESVSQV